jgi:hypothetical protein
MGGGAKHHDLSHVKMHLFYGGIMTVRVKLLICTGQNKQRFQVILISIINLYAHVVSIDKQQVS